MDKASQTLVAPGKTREEAKEAAVAMYRVSKGKEPSKKEMEELEWGARKTLTIRGLILEFPRKIGIKPVAMSESEQIAAAKSGTSR